MNFKRANMELEQIANREVEQYLKKNPDLRGYQVQCNAKQPYAPPSHDEVHAFLKTLDQDEALRFDVSETDTTVPLHVEAAPEAVDIDLDAPSPEPVILARKRGRTLYYFAGESRRSKRLLWTTQPHLAHRFRDDSELINLVFGFKDDEDLIMRESFENLQLMVVVPPPTPEF